LTGFKGNKILVNGNQEEKNGNKNAEHTTRGVSNVGDAMTSSQQNPHGGGTNGG